MLEILRKCSAVN